MNERMQSCIEACSECHRVCLQTAMVHCLEVGDRHLEPDHFRLMLNCAEMCQTSANFMLSNSPLHAETCDVCSKVCAACAQSCEAIPGMDACSRVCRNCAERCSEMARAA